jgi:hypothetical protein
MRQNRTRLGFLGISICALLLGAGAPLRAQTEGFVSPDILILGDSQISFGSGPAFLEFFTDIKKHCSPNNKQKEDLGRLGEMKVSVIGVRSTSIHSWTARSGAAKNSVCKVDPKWKVNAGSYGFSNMTDNQFVQIGQGKEYQICSAEKSPFEEMFRKNYYDPKLLLLSFLGNSADRWAGSKDLAKRDVKELMRQVPNDIPCIFMTTAPSFSKKVVDLRLKAQKNLMEAFEETGNRCTFVPGMTPKTVAANQGNKNYFRLNKTGMVKDPFHPNPKAAKNFFALAMDDICGAIFQQISKAPNLN